EISAVSLPARELGGDLYDFLPLRADRQGIMIGDVSGKGLPAALRMAVARTVFRAEARRGADPGQTLRAVNQVLIEEMPHGMVTLLYAQVNPLNGRIRFANAGHNYPIVIRQQVDEVEVSGLPLGVADMEDYAEEQITLNPGETALFYTDGVVEAMSEQDELFGFARLQELLGTVGHLKPRALMARILAEVRAWASGQGQDDDITMVLLRRRLTRLSDELHSIAADVVGPLTTDDLWAALGLHEERSAEEWNDVLRALSDLVSGQFGRGIAREILGQLRPVIDEYRLIEASAREAQGDHP
ncbi:MAG TPA: PP2C family protein-serine/threonine phosphatase, partial [Herpetosiphonaceae bacterium]